MCDKNILVVIDPGHTGDHYNPGAVKGYYESKAVYALSLLEKELLEEAGFSVIMTRKMNEDPGLYARGQMAVEAGKRGNFDAVVFMSNHTNAFNGRAYGISVFRSAHLPGSEELGNLLGEAIAGEMHKQTGITNNRGVKTRVQSDGRDWYGVIRGAVSGADNKAKAERGPVAYAFIIEHGFHDNLKECMYLSDSRNLKRLAQIKTEVLKEYFGVKSSQLPYKVRVKTDCLNIRKNPTIDSESEGFTGIGTFTIVEEAVGSIDKAGHSGRWGRLKSGRGWICLEYTEKVA